MVGEIWIDFYVFFQFLEYKSLVDLFDTSAC